MLWWSSQNARVLETKTTAAWMIVINCYLSLDFREEGRIKYAVKNSRRFETTKFVKSTPDSYSAFFEAFFIQCSISNVMLFGFPPTACS
jgi:hypothetical protein